MTDTPSSVSRSPFKRQLLSLSLSLSACSFAPLISSRQRLQPLSWRLSSLCPCFPFSLSLPLGSHAIAVCLPPLFLFSEHGTRSRSLDRPAADVGHQDAGCARCDLLCQTETPTTDRSVGCCTPCMTRADTEALQSLLQRLADF